ncbi:hypothetical protein J3E72DRAFT_376754 [Bipolaris maydis]|uniref:uncharacterized protein n=1 Tax=Cochliobolus heterostrophus TaxID=5016 RepID=UPI0024D085B7|nr:hypothetical protein J3E73DRAFT_372953 [Bipolaris maydis]KAJ5058291.1 hypothetical protein J3E74DRAFT_408537 [Bipolaris maydis]KAJ6195537.1 hypothetical protein J3E72DRAFT_376754 [Bipolaris maydis]KAJ6206315.1 hypothetical protein PSV09DRAFT_2402791 [Bipolaris maydis]KAJ6269028.1 hypothetical protein PSV08DRAFT_353436 [Bipolaris maydis]
MTDQNNGQNNTDNPPQRGGYTRFIELEESLFPDNEGDFASSFMNPRRPGNQSDRPAPFDPRNSGEAWRYVRNRVWTGEAFIYASPPRPEEPMDFDPSQNPFFSKNGTSEVSGSPQAGESSYFGNPQGSGSVSGLQSSRGTTSQSATRKPRQQDKDKFQFVGWNDEAKRTLYRWKRILKKGPSFFLHQFPGETEASVRDAWDKYGEEGKRLYEEWEAAEEE